MRRRPASPASPAPSLTSLAPDLQRHVTSFIGPSDAASVMSLSGSSRGMRGLLANRRARLMDSWRAIWPLARPLMREIERAASLAGRFVHGGDPRPWPGSNSIHGPFKPGDKYVRMAVQEGVVFGHPNWSFHGSEDQKGMWFMYSRRNVPFEMVMNRGPIRGDDGAVLRLTIILSVHDNAYEPDLVRLTGNLTYEKATEHCLLEWNITNDATRRSRVRLSRSANPEIADGLLVNVTRALQTSGLHFDAP